MLMLFFAIFLCNVYPVLCFVALVLIKRKGNECYAIIFQLDLQDAMVECLYAKCEINYSD